MTVTVEVLGSAGNEGHQRLLPVIPRYVTIAELKRNIAALPGAPSLAHLGLRLLCHAFHTEQSTYN